MSHQDKKSLIGQADARLQKMTQAGVERSKHQDKIVGMAEGRNHSGTLKPIHAAG